MRQTKAFFFVDFIVLLLVMGDSILGVFGPLPLAEQAVKIHPVCGYQLKAGQAAK
jgi:hypothetical protein